MTVRTATLADLAVLEELWRAFAAEVPPPLHVDVDEAQELAEIREIVAAGLAWVAEWHGQVAGLALARRRSPRLARLTDLYVRPEARGHGLAEALVREVVARLAGEGVEALDLEVSASNGAARSVYGRWGFREDVLTLVAPLDDARCPARGGARTDVVRLHPRPDRRRRRDRAGARDLRAAPAGRLARLHRVAAA